MIKNNLCTRVFVNGFVIKLALDDTLVDILL